jgi:hypothetical protein
MADQAVPHSDMSPSVEGWYKGEYVSIKCSCICALVVLVSKPLEVYLTTLKIYSHCLSTVQLPLPLGCESVFLPTATVIISAAILTMTSKILILKLFIPEKTDSGNDWNSLFSHGDNVLGHIAWHHINHSLTAVFHTGLVLMSKPTHFGKYHGHS